MTEVVTSFWGHLTEFIVRMKVVLGVFLVSLIVLLVLPANSDFFAVTDSYKPLMSVFLTYIQERFLPGEATLFAQSISDPLTLYVYAALVFAVGFTLPVFAYEAYKFVTPALHENEKKAIFPYVTAATILFIVGGLFGFFFLAPSFIQGFFPFYTAVNVVKMLPVMDFYNMVFFTVIVAGLIFTIPVFFVLLVKFNIIKTKMITGKRKYIYAGLLIAALFISPGAGPLGDLYLFIALTALVEISIAVGKRFEPRLPSEQSAIQPRLFASPTCRFCKSVTDLDAPFCPSCHRSMR
jgi:sec-independent protein translocase protein TatC